MKTLAMMLWENQERETANRIYRRQTSPSKSGKAPHQIVVYYGGTFERPNISCDCVKYEMSSPHECRHTKEAWDNCDGVDKMFILHHDEITDKLRNGDRQNSG